MKGKNSLTIASEGARAVTVALLSLSVLSALLGMRFIGVVLAETRTWIVDDDGPADFHIIQEAIDAASPGDTVFVKMGTYYENIVFRNRHYIPDGLSIIGEDNERTIIDAQGGRGITICDERNIIVKSLTIRNGGAGIWVYFTDGGPDNVVIENCIITDNNIGIEICNDYLGFTVSQNIIEYNTIGIGSHLIACRQIISGNIIRFNEQYGIRLSSTWHLEGNVISGNTITNNGYGGIYLYMKNPICRSGNTITDNTLINNGQFGIKIEVSNNNLVYHNNLIGHVIQAYDTNPAENNWHHPDLLVGNHWSDYPGFDDGSGVGKHAIADDGIGDTDVPWPGPEYDFYPYIHENGWITPVDTTPPVTTLSLSDALGLEGWYLSDVTVTLSATDDISGVDETLYRIDEAAWNTYQEPFIITTEGIITVDYHSTDNADNVETIKTEIIKIDKTPPEIIGFTTTSPIANNWYNIDVIVHFEASDMVSGLAYVTPDTTLTSEGADQQVTGTAMDVAGNTNSYIVTGINIDKTPPDIKITSPTNYKLYTVGMNLVFSASDDMSGLKSIWGELTNTEGGTQIVEDGFQPDLGVYTLVVKAKDNADNMAVSASVFFVVYDPEGGFATGGGWFYPDSESTLPGNRANFGFVAKYRKGSSTGNLEFQYKDAQINLKSTSIDWIVISSKDAQFQGTGTINGEGLYTFRVKVKDNGEPGAGTDEFDIRIWEGIDIEGELYHKAKNVISGGNIKVHKKDLHLRALP